MSRILVIEDDPAILRGLADNLRFESHEVLTAADGEAGYRLIRERSPDLVILDLMLPGMDGKDVCRALKSNPLTQSIPIIMLTAKSEEMDRVVGFELGADDYVTKPFSPRELVLRVKAILRRKEVSPEGGKVLQIGDLLIDIDRHQVSVKKKVLQLTSTEFKLLVELVSNKGRVQTRERLLDKVWGYTYEGYARTVDTHIRRLREKLGATGDLIETIRGVGYRFREEGK